MSATAGKRVVILKGEPIYDEDGLAAAAIKPGHLVKGVTTVAVHSTAGGNTPRRFAVERSEMARGVTDDYQDIPALASAYAVGDTVKVACCYPGMRILARIASGQSIVADGQLESAGDGTLRAIAAGTPLARCLETTGVVTSETLVRVEIM